MIDERYHEYEVKYDEGLPVEHRHVEGVVQEVKPEPQDGRIQEAVDLGLRLEGGVLVLELEQVPEVQGATVAWCSGCGGWGGQLLI